MLCEENNKGTQQGQSIKISFVFKKNKVKKNYKMVHDLDFFGSPVSVSILVSFFRFPNNFSKNPGFIAIESFLTPESTTSTFTTFLWTAISATSRFLTQVTVKLPPHVTFSKNKS